MSDMEEREERIKQNAHRDQSGCLGCLVFLLVLPIGIKAYIELWRWIF